MRPEVGSTFELKHLTQLANLWNGVGNYGIQNALQIEIELNLHGDPIGQVVQRGVKRSASEPLAIEGDPDSILIECDKQVFPVHKSILSGNIFKILKSDLCD